MVRSTRKTALVYGEGKSEVEWLGHLRSMYGAGNPSSPKVIARQAGGKGGGNVVSTLLGTASCEHYDRLFALIDLDLPPSSSLRKQAEKKKVSFIEFEPCLEGFLLKVLGHDVPADSAACKTKLRGIDPRNVYAPEFFAANFPRALLDQRREHVPELDAIIKIFGA